MPIVTVWVHILSSDRSTADRYSRRNSGHSLDCNLCKSCIRSHLLVVVA